jgi:hypothetical protein
MPGVSRPVAGAVRQLQNELALRKSIANGYASDPPAVAIREQIAQLRG